MEALFEGLQENKKIDWEFYAAINGIDLGKEQRKSAPSAASDPVVPLFLDPESYQSMSLEEREAMTTKMKKIHKRWAGQSFLKGK